VVEGWAYSAAGPWTNQTTIARLASLYTGFADAAATHRRYDASNICTNPFLGPVISQVAPGERRAGRRSIGRLEDLH